jgi:predicted metal-dependent hydrolase
MTTEARQMTVSGIRVAVVRKAIKNLHLGVYPPDGRVRIAAPLKISDAAVRVAVITKLGWIRRRQNVFARQERMSQREMVDGESHYYLGRRYRLQLVETRDVSAVVFRRARIMELHVRPGLTAEQRERILNRWYRERLRELIPPLMEKWQDALGVQLTAWGIKRMKTKWGSCNAKARRVWLNLELVKRPPECLEYIVVHELVHLIARHHDDQFQALMDRHLPKWRIARQALYAVPLAHDNWA